MASSRSDGDEGLFAAINVTPLVDITLVLLIIFMVAAPLIVTSPSIKVALPQAVTAEATKASTLVLSLQREPSGSGYKLFSNGKETDERSIRAAVPGMVKNNPELQAVIAADKGIAYGDVMHIVDVVRELGVTKFALNAETGNSGS
jgi:biopolymer transport protein ExbD